jgi:hypothetical protein
VTVGAEPVSATLALVVRVPVATVTDAPACALEPTGEAEACTETLVPPTVTVAAAVVLVGTAGAETDTAGSGACGTGAGAGTIWPVTVGGGAGGAAIVRGVTGVETVVVAAGVEVVGVEIVVETGRVALVTGVESVGSAEVTPPGTRPSARAVPAPALAKTIRPRTHGALRHSTPMRFTATLLVSPQANRVRERLDGSRSR